MALLGSMRRAEARAHRRKTWPKRGLPDSLPMDLGWMLCSSRRQVVLDLISYSSLISRAEWPVATHLLRAACALGATPDVAACNAALPLQWQAAAELLRHMGRLQAQRSFQSGTIEGKPRKTKQDSFGCGSKLNQ